VSVLIDVETQRLTLGSLLALFSGREG